MCPYGNTCLSERVHLLYSPNKLTLRHKTWVYLYNSKLKNSIKNAVNFLCLLTLFDIRHFRGICSSVHVQRKVGNPCFTPISLQTFIHFNSLFGILWRPFASSAVAVRLRIQDDICAKPVISLLNGKSSADLHIILLVKRNNFEIMFLAQKHFQALWCPYINRLPLCDINSIFLCSETCKIEINVQCLQTWDASWPCILVVYWLLFRIWKCLSSSQLCSQLSHCLWWWCCNNCIRIRAAIR